MLQVVPFLIYVSTPALKEFFGEKEEIDSQQHGRRDGGAERELRSTTGGVECQHANIAPHNGGKGGLLCHIRDTSGESF